MKPFVVFVVGVIVGAVGVTIYEILGLLVGMLFGIFAGVAV